MIPIVTPTTMRAIDAASSKPVETLIERAGTAVARVAVDMLGGTYGRTVCVLAGPGNNGADGRVAAKLLRERGVLVHDFDPSAMPPVLPHSDLVIDAAFGTGFRGVWEAPDVGRAVVLAVDVPTGLDALTGRAPGGLLPADRTVTFAAVKPGHLLADGPDVVGELVVADIGLEIVRPDAWLVEASDIAAWWPARDRRAHKWSAAVRAVAGSDGMFGAAALAAGAAQRAGAGMVVLSTPGAPQGNVPAPPEVVQRFLPASGWAPSVLADLDRFDAVLIGPGLGRSEATVEAVVEVIRQASIPAVVDGDGLFALTWNELGSIDWLAEREAVTVLTPHDGEFALLTGSPPPDDRLAAVKQLAVQSGATVLLKGPTTVVSEPDGDTWVIAAGDERLATAGTGDVLTGIVAGLLACGVAPGRAAASAAWTHAAASRCHPRCGLVASDLIASIPTVLSEVFRVSGAS